MTKTISFLSLIFGIAFALTTQEYESIVEDIHRYLIPPRDDYINSADFFGGVVRLAFHDAASYDKSDGSGRPSGCINLLDPGNGGLAEIINGIEPVYQMHKTELSRADYWALVAHVSVKAAGGPYIAYQWGRQDCNGNYPPPGRLPNNEGNFTELYNVFIQRMGLSVRDVVALLGAHTIGRCMPENSGYQYYFSRTADLFNNQYYKDLLSLQWKRNTNKFAFHDTTHEWNDPPPTNGSSIVRLNADISLVYNIGAGGDGACQSTTDSSCTINEQTYSIVKEFANHLGIWLTDFAEAFDRLTSLGYTLQPLIPVNTPTPTPN